MCHIRRMEYALIAIAIMAVVTLLKKTTRQRAFERSALDWVIDLSSLGVHFLVMPILGIALGNFLRRFVPTGYEGVVDLPAPAVALIFMVVTDYLWYWNHRAFHAQTRFWNLHEVHHNAKVFDIYMSPRNTLWSPLLFIYLWSGALGALLLKDPAGMTAGAAISLVINFWGHTSFGPRAGSRFHRLLAAVFITPHEHAWHHSSDSNHHNFATVFSFWDRWHGTYHSPVEKPAAYGFPSAFSPVKQILFPF